MALSSQTSFGESLELTVSTQVIDGVCYTQFKSGGKLIRKSMFGFGPQQFKRADDAATNIVMLTGAKRIDHSSIYCDRTHKGVKCNNNDAMMSPGDLSLR